jgi:HPt (histidine-containing phosphotransfer) domain-containing protein
MSDRKNIINMSYLNSISNGDNSFLRDLIDLFFEQIPDYQEKLKDLNNKKDWQNLAKTAHKAKSAIIMMGMDDIARELKKMEENAKEEKIIGDYQEIIAKFVNDTNSALVELKDIKEKIT